LLCYVEVVAADETPLPIGLDDSTIVSAGAPSVVAASSAIIQQSQLPKLPVLAKTTTTTCKIMQSQARFGMVVRTVGGDIVTIMGVSGSFLQVLERTTAECLRSADYQRQAMSTFAERFKAKTRVAIMDSAPSNLRAERAVMRDREIKGGWQHLALGCEVHRTSSAYKCTFGLLDEDIRGQIH